MRLANRLWNLLVKIERTRVARYLLIMFDADQERIDALKARILALKEEVKARRQAARKKVAAADLQEQIKAIRAEMGPLIERRKATSGQRHNDRRAELTANTERASRRIVKARQAAASMGLYWGTYNEIIQRADAGRKHGGELHYRGFRGQGTLTAQIMGGARVEQCVGAETTQPSNHAFQIDSDGLAGVRRRSHGTASRRTDGHLARVRIGSNPDRSPIWWEVPVASHRDLPADADIRSVSITRRIVAGKPTQQLNVTVNVPRPPKIGGAAIAIDIGWRLLPEGVRVAYWQDDMGRHGQVLVPQAVIEQSKKVAEIRSICDRYLDGYRPALASWLEGQQLSDEWRTQTAYLAQWKSGDRLAALIRWWGDRRIEGDGETYEAMAACRKQYLHLSNWWRNLQDQVSRRVKEQYRLFAAGVRSYGTVIIEEFDLRDVAEMPEPDSQEAKPRGAYRQMVSPSVFRGALLNACGREGLEVVKLDAAYSTRTCHVCGHAGKWDSAASVMHRCGQCGELFDQDQNAAINLLTAWHGTAKAVEVGV
jgi:hypothetical protein